MSSEKITVYDVMPGSKMISYKDEKILAGVPSEVIKSIMTKRLPGPTALLLPDINQVNSIPQNATEFPLYHFLFFSNSFKENNRLKVLGTKQQVDNNEELLRLTLLGPTYEEMVSAGANPEKAKQIARETDYFTMKNDDGSMKMINDIIESIPTDHRGDIMLDGLRISKSGYNKFTFTTETDEVEIDLSFKGIQYPPYPIVSDFTPNELSKFSCEILGGSSGFSPTSASTGMVICHDGTYMLVDGIPFLNFHLRSRGVSKNQIRSIFMSHIHDDHCNMLPLMFAEDRIEVLTTPEIYWMCVRKLALMLDKTDDEIKQYFDFVPITPGKTFEYYGLHIKPHYSVHSIPTIGATFEVKYRRNTYSIIITGDNQSLKDIRNMHLEGILTEERVREIEDLYVKHADLLLADGGEGMIHGEPQDAIKSKAERIVFVHLDKLPPEFNATFSVASAGKRYVIVQGENDFYSTRAIECLLNHFPKMKPRWFSHMMGDMHITRFNTDDVIIKQGAESSGKIYVVLTGICEVVIHDGKKPTTIAIKEAGEIFGEMAIIAGQRIRNASIIAKTPVTLCELSEEIFLSFVTMEELKDYLVDLWECRKNLEEVNLFKSFSTYVIDKLAAISEKRVFKKEDIIIKKGSISDELYTVISGKVMVDLSRDKQIYLESGAVFGEMAPFTNTSRMADVVAVEDSICYSFKGEKLLHIVNETPVVLYFFKEVISNRVKQNMGELPFEDR